MIRLRCFNRNEPVEPEPDHAGVGKAGSFWAAMSLHYVAELEDKMKSTLLSAAVLGIFAGAGTAQDRPELVVYTYDSFVSEWGPGPIIEPLFEATCDCDLKLVPAGDGAAVLSRLQLEGQHSDADVVLGLDTSISGSALASGLFTAHGIALPELNLPVDWNDPIFIPFDWGYFAFVYDTTRLSHPPTSFTDLRNVPDSFKIIIEDPRSSTPGLGLLLWIKQVFGDDADQVWADIAPNILTVTAGWSEAYGLFLQGEADMVLSYTTSPAYHLIAEYDDSKAAAAFVEGHYMQVETAAILKSSDQPELARQFLEFVLSDDFQAAIPTTNWMYPVRIPVSGLPSGFDTMIVPTKSLLFSNGDAANVRDEALAEWIAALAR